MRSKYVGPWGEIERSSHGLGEVADGRRAIAAGRLYGMVMDGHWLTVGTPDAIPLAERAIAAATRQGS